MIIKKKEYDHLAFLVFLHLDEVCVSELIPKKTDHIFV